jgi:hypothetical protein
MASAGFREVKVWRRQETVDKRWTPHPALGLKIAAGIHLGREIVGVNGSGDLLVIDTGSGKEKRRAEGVFAGAKSLETSSDGAFVWVGWETGRGGVWNLDGSGWVGASDFMEGTLARWSVDGQRVAALGPDNSVRIWKRPAAGSADWNRTAEWNPGVPLIDVAWDAEGARLLGVGEDGKIRIWSVAEGKVTLEIAVAGVTTAAFSRDGKRIAAAGVDGIARVLEVASGKVTVELRMDWEAARRIEKGELESGRIGLDVAHFTKEAARLEGENKALDELLKKANQTIESAKKTIP